LFLLQVVAGSAMLAIFLMWAANEFGWVALREQPWRRIGLLAALLLGSVLIYFGALWAAGVKLLQLLRR
jgi:putative peptidoglycan lipid II flippase